MRKAAAWNVTGIDRSTQALAEEAARRAGMTLGDWLDEVVSEQAAGQGVGAEDVADDDRLESVEGRLERLTSRDRAAARRSRSNCGESGEFASRRR